MALSINHNAHTGALPDFRNLGILLRILLIVNGVVVLAALLQVQQLRDWPRQITGNAALVEPLLILSLLVLAALGRVLRRLPYAAGTAVVVAIEAALTAVLHYASHWLLIVEPASLTRWVVLVVLVTLMLLAYFDLRGRALSPALAEARLQALQARIRPHFLFNSMNTIASLTRSDPGRAEEAVEDLADLFRANLSDARTRIPLKEVLEVARIYQRIEQLRLGDRLQVRWNVADTPMRALVPSLLVQPLLENAVYHGIETLPQGGTVTVTSRFDGSMIELEVRNPLSLDTAPQERRGNRLALDNIRQRLDLAWPGQSRVEVMQEGGEYRVLLAFPYEGPAV